MKFYFAPLEGLTDSIFRQLHHRFFPGVDGYYMPFLSPTLHHSLSARERRELPPAERLDAPCVPQILTKSPEDFLWAASLCRDLGYEEVNLNLGCPSGTVVAKGKGAGMLESPAALDAFLEKIFSGTPVKISVKTRLGLTGAGEFPAILEVLNRYPLAGLILHPRVQKAFYKGPVDLEAFGLALEASKCPVCYNGDICTPEDMAGLRRRFPRLEAMMIGRGFIGCPGLLSPGGTTREGLIAFHGALLEAYCDAFGNRRNAMFRLKENWQYLLCLFEGAEKLGKRLRKTTDFGEFCAITGEILENLPMRPALCPDWREKWDLQLQVSSDII